ncbi:MAG: sigma-54 dependent transcriptional regulator [gamma proteobacterium symbiont of Taylorina sp.]|nr:sigma-54 dependent transcriptional regulator [gamma proteobacterium symbiont of Taylorina sp.]
MSKKILVIEDDELLNQMIVHQLKSKGYLAFGVNSLAQTREYLGQYEPDLIISDMRLPDGECIDELPSLIESQPVVVLTAYGTVQNAVEAIQAGAAHYLTKPVSPDELILTVQRVLDAAALEADHKFCKSRLKAQHDKHPFMIGQSPALEQAKELIDAVAPSEMTVLILGESGSGKELVARAIHEQSRRADKHFVAVDCCTLQENLFESELFGHEKGAFTGADKKKNGLIEGAYGGTLFLDEIGEIPPAIQAKLLRVLETGIFRRVGGTKDLTSNVRIVAATNRDLKKMSESKEFRADLFYRLDAFSIYTPPLRERRDDIPFLVDHFIRNHNFSMCVKKTVVKEAMRKLIAYDWPGNVRELKNMVERAIILSRNSKIIRGRHFNLKDYEQSKKGFQLDIMHGTDPTLEDIEACYLKLLLGKHAGHRTTIAQVMGISERHVYRLISKYNLAKEVSLSQSRRATDMN